MTAMNQVINFIKKETILIIALLLAFLSMFIVPPCAAYTDYIDWNTLLLLFCLMAVVAGLQKLGVFSIIADHLLLKTHTTRQLLLSLVFLPFFFSMMITNDVALITFVPFALVVLRLAKKEQLLLPVVVLQTLAANLGSMLMPMGNPQNLYLYNLSGISLFHFLQLMFPLFLLSALILLVTIYLLPNKPLDQFSMTPSSIRQKNKKNSSAALATYLILLFLCILSVLKILPSLWLTILIILYLLFFDRKIFKKVDYSLLATFTGFFIFIGNISQIEFFRNAMQAMITGHEIPVAILSSQLISNVPAALLLSGFTRQYTSLIIGTNLGGLGTLIASMASLISYKQIAKNYPEKRLSYLILFTIANLLILGILYGSICLFPSLFLP